MESKRYGVTDFKLSGLKLFEPKVFTDDRGFFTELYRHNEFSEYGLPRFVQDNYSSSGKKVLRGLHFQYEKPQGKLVICTRGKVLDVAVDIRKNSPTFGKYEKIVLEGGQPKWFWIPAGFAHGFFVMSSEGADLLYKVDNYYNAKGESALAWNDPDLKIDWGVQNPLVSPKDQSAMSFSDYSKNFNYSFKEFLKEHSPLYPVPHF